MIIHRQTMSGKKHIFILLLLLFSGTFMNAQEGRRHDLSADVTAQGLVGYNYTHQWYGGADVKGVLRVDNVDFSLNIEALTTKTFSFGLTVTPSFEVCRNGFVFLDGTMHSRLFSKYDVCEFVYAGSAGFRMRHFSVQFGFFSRTIEDIGRDWHSLENYVVEPFNLLYKVSISIMGYDNPWDVYLVGSDYTEFEYERMWEPIFTLGGRYDFKDRWSAVAEGTLKPSGMFHLDASFYSATLRVGVKYKIK